MKDVVIVGAGIGGLALARALRVKDARCRVRILERAPGPPPDRFGITLAPNGLEVMAALGLLEGLREKGRVLHGIEVIPSGSEDRARFDFSRLRSPVRFAVATLPSVLHDLFTGSLGSETEILFGHDLSEIVREGGQVREVIARSAAGERRLPADVVIGADGVKSTVRKFVTDARVEHPVDEGYQIVLGGGIPGVHAVQQYVAPGRLLGVVPCAADRTFIFWLTHRHEVATTRQQPIERFKATLARFAPVIESAIDSIRDWNQVLPVVIDLTRTRKWACGEVALLGDTVHATTPSLAQGANMALVDAACLGESLAEWSKNGSGRDALHGLMRRYVARRWRQTSFQYFLGRAVVKASVTEAAAVGYARFAMLKLLSRTAASQRLLLEMVVGLRPRSFVPTPGARS